MAAIRLVLALAVALASLPRSVVGQTPDAPAHAEEVPVTPFDEEAGTWTVVVLPDTQNLVQVYPDAFRRQLDWIVAHRESHHIQFVLHEGDITNRNTPEQWRVAREGFQPLIDAGIPFAVVPGNHDYGDLGKCNDRSTLLNEYFSPSDYRHSDRVGYFEEERLENTWHEFPTPAGIFRVLALEFGPRDEVLAWANEVMASDPDRPTIVLTHAYLFHDDTRYDWDRYGAAQSGNPRKYGVGLEGNANDGEAIWEKLVSRHAGMRFVLSGHVLGDGSGYIASVGVHGNTVHQILANYQNSVKPHRPFGGGAYLRLMQFHPDGAKVRVRTYSPWLDQWMTGPGHDFEIELPAVAMPSAEPSGAVP